MRRILVALLIALGIGGVAAAVFLGGDLVRLLFRGQVGDVEEWRPNSGPLSNSCWSVIMRAEVDAMNRKMTREATAQLREHLEKELAELVKVNGGEMVLPEK